MKSFVAIADPTHRQIIELLAACERTAGELEDWLEKTRSLWSRLLDALERELRAENEANKPEAKKTFPHEK